MTDPTASAVVALLAGFALAVLLAVPFIAVSYRRRGELGAGHALLAFAFLVYLMSLWTYTLLPIPDATPAWCSQNAASHLQLRPLQFVADIGREQHGAGLRSYLHNPAIQQAVFNVALFLPLGMFLRHLFRRGPLTTVAIGLAVSLFIECTQLTGNWYLSHCPYRLFDVDDMLTNTVGVAAGFAVGPVLRLVPWQRTGAPPGQPRPVTARRRLLGMAVDLLSVVLLGATLSIIVTLLSGERLSTMDSVVLGDFLPAVLLLYIVPLLGDGASFGQRVVLLRPLGPDGQRPSPARMTVRFVTGSGGYFLLLGLSPLLHVSLELAAFGWLLLSGIMAIRPRGHRGLSGIIAGLHVVDARGPADTPAREAAEATTS